MHPSDAGGITDPSRSWPGSRKSYSFHQRQTLSRRGWRNLAPAAKLIVVGPLSSGANSKLGFSATWSMAVGGMVGGGIFSTLGVVIGIAGEWAWLSFVVAGLIALTAGYSYVKLAAHYGEGGGAFTFLRKIDADGFAGSLSWVLIVGYVLTNAVYAITFGEYLGHVVGLGAWFPHAAAVAILALFIGLNLRGVGEAGGVEVFLVWFKLAVLVGLAGWGLAHWDPSMLSRGVPATGIGALVVVAVLGRPLLLRHTRGGDQRR